VFGLGPWELVIILLVVVFVFGGKRLAQLGEGLGKSISEFKKGIRDERPPANEAAKETEDAGKDSQAAKKP
jgi:sec-independent protein translocase protein TatA